MKHLGIFRWRHVSFECWFWAMFQALADLLGAIISVATFAKLGTSWELWFAMKGIEARCKHQKAQKNVQS